MTICQGLVLRAPRRNQATQNEAWKRETTPPLKFSFGLAPRTAVDAGAFFVGGPKEAQRWDSGEVDRQASREENNCFEGNRRRPGMPRAI